MGNQPAHERQVGTLCPGIAGRLVGPARAHEPGTQVGDVLIGDVQREGYRYGRSVCRDRIDFHRIRTPGAERVGAALSVTSVPTRRRSARSGAGRAETVRWEAGVGNWWCID